MFEAADDGGRHLDVRFEVSHQLWPWSGYLALYLRVKESGADYDGLASGNVSCPWSDSTASAFPSISLFGPATWRCTCPSRSRSVLCTVLAPLALHSWHFAHSPVLM